MDILPLIMRWAHILSAVVAVGGVFFMYAVLRPAASVTLSTEMHDALRNAIRSRWQKIVHVVILLFLVSGLYNYIVVLAPQHQDQPLYHALFGVKFILAFAVFGLAEMLSSGKQRAQAKQGTFLGILLSLAVVIVLISGVLRALPKTNPADAPLSTPETVTLPE